MTLNIIHGICKLVSLFRKCFYKMAWVLKSSLLKLTWCKAYEHSCNGKRLSQQQFCIPEGHILISSWQHSHGGVLGFTRKDSAELKLSYFNQRTQMWLTSLIRSVTELPTCRLARSIQHGDIATEMLQVHSLPQDLQCFMDTHAGTAKL